MKNSRREFLKDSAAAITAVGAPKAWIAQAPRPKPPLTTAVLQAIAEVVLPATALGSDGISKVLTGFRSWLDGFEPVAEMDHPYLTSSEIRYGPPDPGPRWQSQLEALDLEAQKKYGNGFAQLGLRERRQMIELAMREDRLDRLPATADAHHIAVALVSYFYSTPDATDLCYEASIRRWGCGGLEAGVQKPAPRGRG